MNFQKLPDTDVVKQLRSEIIQHFSPHWELNDRGHRAEHFEEVFQCARYLNDKLGLGFNDVDMLFAGYFHDLFAWSRVNHHLLAYHYFVSTDHPIITMHYHDRPLSRLEVAYGCLEHRASFKEKFTYKFSELINSADRGFPGDTQRLFSRVMKHHTDINPGKSADEITAISLEFIKRKAGTNGYCRYPDIYFSVFGEELKKQQSDIDNLGK